MTTPQSIFVHPDLLGMADLQAILGQVTYRDWAFNAYLGVHEGPHLQIVAMVQDAFGPGKVPLDIHVRIPRVARRDEDHFLDWLLERIQIAENHETREFFKVQGRVFNSPHKENADRDVS